MIDNNKGMTLVELVVTIGIMVIVGSAIAGFVMAGTRQYRKANEEVNLQYEAQLTLNQIQDLLIDVTNGVSYSLNDAMVMQDSEYVPATAETIDKKVICAYNCESVNTAESENAIFTATEVKWDEKNHTLTYSKYRYKVEADGSYSRQKIVDDTLFAQYVEGFSADLSKVDTERVVGVTLDFKCGNRTYSTTNKITLRNQILVNKGPEETFREVSLKLVPTVTDVVVNPSEVYVDAGTEFSGFTAKVVGTNYPVQGIEWSISDATVLDDPSKTYIDPNTGKLIIDADETCKVIQINATSLQSKLNAGTDKSKYVAGTATVLNKYIKKSGAVTMTEPEETVDLKAKATVCIHGENFEGNEDFTSQIGFLFKDKSGNVLNDIEYQLNRKPKQSAGTQSEYSVVFKAPEKYKDTEVSITAQFEGQNAPVNKVTFRKRALKSIILQAKGDDGEWKDYQAGEEHPSKRGENLAFQLIAIYVNDEMKDGEERLTLTSSDDRWKEINWGFLFNGVENDDLEHRMGNNLSTDGVVQISSAEDDFKAQSEYRFSVMASLDGQNASMTVTLPKVSLKIKQAHAQTQNALGMLVGTAGNKKSAEITFDIQGIVETDQLVELLSPVVDGVNVTKVDGKDSFMVWTTKENNFDLEFGLSGISDISTKIHVISKDSNVLRGNEVMSYYIPPENNDVTFFKGTQSIYYDLYGNKVTYKKQGVAMIDGTTYQYHLNDKQWNSK